MLIELFCVKFECEGDYVAGTPDKWNGFIGTWEPGASRELENFKIYLGGIDVTAGLPKKQYQELYDAYLCECQENEECA